jgi:hypothetical protein
MATVVEMTIEKIDEVKSRLGRSVWGWGKGSRKSLIPSVFYFSLEQGWSGGR